MKHKHYLSRFPLKDLKALIMSPLLLDDQFPAFADHTVSKEWLRNMQLQSVSLLERLTKDPAPLVQWVAQHPSHRLGHYFEQLFAFWLSHLANISSVYKSTPVVQSGRSLGELDILCFDRNTGETLHFELAIKFYLQTSKDSIEARDFVGPRVQDRLDIKLDRLFQKQLRLLKTEAGLRALPCELQNRPMTSRAFVQGGLFYPIDVWLRSHEPRIPMGLSKTAALGWWVRIASDPDREWLRLKAERWSQLPRLEWMAQQSRSFDDPELQEPEIFWELAYRQMNDKGPAMLAVGYTRDSIHGGWQESTRGFILPATWPFDELIT